jgi:pSer/pThr/pTyr-binding forkhead associated (FHA) protein
MAVGKIHACIRKRNGRYYIVDLNSKNGTYVNGIRLKSNVEHELSDNDEFVLANTVFTFLFPS